MKTLLAFLLLAATALAVDHVPDFVSGPPTSVADGFWDDAATWKGKKVPAADTDAVVNHKVTVRGAVSVRNVNVFGRLSFDSAATSVFKVQTLALPGGDMGKGCGCGCIGRLAVGTKDQPMTGSAEIIFRDLPLDPENDPLQFGNGLLALHGTRVTIYGNGDNVTLRSENPTGVRGHTQFMGDADVRIHGATFANLGRTTADALGAVTNQVGRYAVHLHHIQGFPWAEGGAEYQWEIVNCKILNSRKWALAIHDAHHGLAADNLIDGARGDGIAFEIGNEFGNTVTRNTIRNITKGVQTNEDRNGLGSGIWGRSVSNHVNDNTITNVQGSPISWWCRIGQLLPHPAYRGAFTDLPFVPLQIRPQDGGPWPAAWAGHESDVIATWAGRQHSHTCDRNVCTLPNSLTSGMFVAGCGDPKIGVPPVPIDWFEAHDNKFINLTAQNRHLRTGVEIIYSGNIRLSGTVTSAGIATRYKTNHPERIHEVEDLVFVP